MQERQWIDVWIYELVKQFNDQHYPIFKHRGRLRARNRQHISIVRPWLFIQRVEFPSCNQDQASFEKGADLRLPIQIHFERRHKE
jgi:hypothetical protein